jgi:hypothetical protein
MKIENNTLGKPKSFYETKLNWDKDLTMQCGEKGIVASLSQNKSYITAFFEVFPKSPKIVIRGEGKTLEEAELEAWNKFEKISNCIHSYVKSKNTRDAFCEKCKITVSKYFAPESKCFICGKEHSDFIAYDHNYYCRSHYLDKESFILYENEKLKIIEENKDQIFFTSEELYENLVFDYFFIKELTDRNLYFDSIEYLDHEKIRTISLHFYNFISELCLNILKEKNKDNKLELSDISKKFKIKDSFIMNTLFDIYMKQEDISDIDYSIKKKLLNYIN